MRERAAKRQASRGLSDMKSTAAAIPRRRWPRTRARTQEHTHTRTHRTHTRTQTPLADTQTRAHTLRRETHGEQRRWPRGRRRTPAADPAQTSHTQRARRRKPRGGAGLPWRAPHGPGSRTRPAGSPPTAGGASPLHSLDPLRGLCVRVRVRVRVRLCERAGACWILSTSSHMAATMGTGSTSAHWICHAPRAHASSPTRSHAHKHVCVCGCARVCMWVCTQVHNSRRHPRACTQACACKGLRAPARGHRPPTHSGQQALFLSVCMSVCL